MTDGNRYQAAIEALDDALGRAVEQLTTVQAGVNHALSAPRPDDFLMLTAAETGAAANLLKVALTQLSTAATILADLVGGTPSAVRLRAAGTAMQAAAQRLSAASRELLVEPPRPGGDVDGE